MIEALIEKGEGSTKIEAAHIFPRNSQMKPEEWEAIQDFYSSKALENLEKVPVRTVKKELPHFKVKLSPYRLSPPSTTMIHISKEGFFLGDANTKRLYQFDANIRMSGQPMFGREQYLLLSFRIKC